MKRKKHSAEQIIKKLREADAMIAAGKTIGQVAQALEISEQTFHRWRNQYGGMKAEEAKRLKALEEENKRLKQELQRRSGWRYAIRALLGRSDPEPPPAQTGSRDTGRDRVIGNEATLLYIGCRA